MTSIHPTYTQWLDYKIKSFILCSSICICNLMGIEVHCTAKSQMRIRRHARFFLHRLRFSSSLKTEYTVYHVAAAASAMLYRACAPDFIYRRFRIAVHWALRLCVRQFLPGRGRNTYMCTTEKMDLRPGKYFSFDVIDISNSVFANFYLIWQDNW